MRKLQGNLWADRCLAHRDTQGILSAKCLLYPFPWEERRVASRAGQKTKQTRHGSLESQIIPVQQSQVQGTKPLWQAAAAEGTCAADPAPGEFSWRSSSLNPKPTLPNLLASPWGSSPGSSPLSEYTHTELGAELCPGLLSLLYSRICCNSLPCTVPSHALTASSFTSHMKRELKDLPKSKYPIP